MTTMSANGGDNKLGRVIRLFERIVVMSLVVMMMLVLALGTLELGWIIIKDIITPPVLLLEVDELLDIFGFFLLILIGVELLETIKAYLKDNVIHVEIVFEVAIIAVARKVIVLDLSNEDGITVLFIAALIIALAGAFFLWRSTRSLSKAAAPYVPESGGVPPTTES